MTKKLAVAIIHGIGDQQTDFADECIAKLSRQISGLGFDCNQIAFAPIHWANVVEPAQSRYLNKATQQGNLDFRSVRKFVVSALGDAGAYQKVDSAHNSTYSDIHAEVSRSLQTLLTHGVSGETPLIVMAHSLGGHIMSNYIWDIQHQQPDATKTDFEQMNTLSGMITFGSNIPLFTFAYPDVQPITFPPSALSDDLKPLAKWLNFYDPDDVLGYPLKAINPQYEAVVDEDIVINVGGFLTSWNPLSHNGYWTDKDFIRPVAAYISQFLE